MFRFCARSQYIDNNLLFKVPTQGVMTLELLAAQLWAKIISSQNVSKISSVIQNVEQKWRHWILLFRSKVSANKWISWCLCMSLVVTVHKRCGKVILKGIKIPLNVLPVSIRPKGLRKTCWKYVRFIGTCFSLAQALEDVEKAVTVSPYILEFVAVNDAVEIGNYSRSVWGKRKVWKSDIKRMLWISDFVLNQFRTQEMCVQVVKKEPLLLRYVHDCYRREKMYQKMILLEL